VELSSYASFINQYNAMALVLNVVNLGRQPSAACTAPLACPDVEVLDWHADATKSAVAGCAIITFEIIDDQPIECLSRAMEVPQTQYAYAWTQTDMPGSAMRTPSMPACPVAFVQTPPVHRRPVRDLQRSGELDAARYNHRKLFVGEAESTQLAVAGRVPACDPEAGSNDNVQSDVSQYNALEVEPVAQQAANNIPKLAIEYVELNVEVTLEMMAEAANTVDEAAIMAEAIEAVAKAFPGDREAVSKEVLH